MPRVLPGLRVLASEYDDFLVDLWGVIHDGERPFEGVVAALEALTAAGRRVLFVTNSSRTGARVEEMLVGEIGIARELFDAAVSSGDVTRSALAARDPLVFGLLPDRPRVFHHGDPSFVPWLFELGLDFVADLSEADLVVATGSVRDAAALAEVRAFLAPAAARSVPLVCTNPDRVIPVGRSFTLGPGAVAQAYEDAGGRAFLYGKPHQPIYAAARRRLGEGDRRLVAIGDLLATDIRGARAAGLPSVLVMSSGVHASALGPEPTLESLDALFAAEGVTPDMVVPRFAW